jgi:hypothetical protein
MTGCRENRSLSLIKAQLELCKHWFEKEKRMFAVSRVIFSPAISPFIVSHLYISTFLLRFYRMYVINTTFLVIYFYFVLHVAPSISSLAPQYPLYTCTVRRWRLVYPYWYDTYILDTSIENSSGGAPHNTEI